MIQVMFMRELGQLYVDCIFLKVKSSFCFFSLYVQIV